MSPKLHDSDGCLLRVQRLVRLWDDLAEDVATTEELLFAVVKDPHHIVRKDIRFRSKRRIRERARDRCQCAGAGVDIGATVAADNPDGDRSHVVKIAPS